MGFDAPNQDRIMANNSLLDRLDGLESRFEEVSTLITDPSVIGDQPRYVKLTKEYHDLEQILKVRNEYAAALDTIEESRQILGAEDDDEMRQLAREELEAAQARIPRLEEEIKILLIPADPDDVKNAVVEIRGGTGGDEAALFAGDLFRMYQKFAESKGWQLAVSSCSDGAAGGFKEIVLRPDRRGCVLNHEIRGQESTACSASPLPRPRAASTRRPPPWPCSPRPMPLTSR